MVYVKKNLPSKSQVEISCEFCAQIFGYKQLYYKHANSHHQFETSSKWISCSQCSMFYPTDKALRRHCSKAHSLVNPDDKVGCQFCPKFERNGYHLYKHCNERHPELVRVHWLSCSIPDCKMFYPTPASLEHHTNIKHFEHQTVVRCEFCPYTSTKNQCYIRHARTKHSDCVRSKWLRCDRCPQNENSCLFPNQEVLTKHINSIHSCLKGTGLNQNRQPISKVRPSVSCDFCAKMFNSPAEYAKHALIRHKDKIMSLWIKCDLCEQYHPSSYAVKRHMKRKHSTRVPKIQVQCDFCSTIVCNHLTFIRHCNSIHQDQIQSLWLQCDQCTCFYPSLERLENHKKSFHKVDVESNESNAKVGDLKVTKRKRMREEATCQWCGKLFKAYSTLSRHCHEFHLEEISNVWTKCEVCSKFFPTERQADRHKIWFHPDKKPSEPPAKVQCQFCPEIFPKLHQYYRHASMQHLDLISEAWFSCDQCTKMFPAKQGLILHKTSQHGKLRTPALQCNFCDYGARDNKSWLRHINKHHQRQIKTTWIPCTVCKLFLPDEQSLDRHMNSSYGHRDKKTGHPCSFCPKVFVATYSLYNHANDHHLEQLEAHWLQCSVCKSYFPDESSLKNHTIHAHQYPRQVKAPKPIPCTFCPEICLTKNNFIQHANSSHMFEITDSKWKMCAECHSYFPDRNSYKEHNHKDFLDAQKDSIEKEIKCPFCLRYFQTVVLMCTHVKRRHPESAPSTWITCTLCQFSLPSVPIFAMHNQQTHQFYTCYTCQKKFSAESMLLTHAQQKHGLSSIDSWLRNQENSREIVLKTSDAFDNSPEQHMLDARVSDVQVSLSSNFLRSWHKCDECNCYLSSRKLLRKHFNLHHSVFSQMDEPLSNGHLDCEDIPLKRTRTFSPKKTKFIQQTGTSVRTEVTLKDSKHESENCHVMAASAETELQDCQTNSESFKIEICNLEYSLEQDVKPVLPQNDIVILPQAQLDLLDGLDDSLVDPLNPSTYF